MATQNEQNCQKWGSKTPKPLTGNHYIKIKLVLFESLNSKIGGRVISRFSDVNKPPHSCGSLPLRFFERLCFPETIHKQLTILS